MCAMQIENPCIVMLCRANPVQSFAIGRKCGSDLRVGKDEVPGPNPGISSIKSPSDIDAEGDFFVVLFGF